MSVQLYQAGGENPHCTREALGFIGGAFRCEYHYWKVEKCWKKPGNKLQTFPPKLVLDIHRRRDR